MADRSLRGIRLGAQSLQSEEGVVFMERRTRAELEELLEERLAFIRARRGAGEDPTREKIGA
jgi:hypothetical protein